MCTKLHVSSNIFTGWCVDLLLKYSSSRRLLELGRVVPNGTYQHFFRTVLPHFTFFSSSLSFQPRRIFSKLHLISHVGVIIFETVWSTMLHGDLYSENIHVEFKFKSEKHDEELGFEGQEGEV